MQHPIFPIVAMSMTKRIQACYKAIRPQKKTLVLSLVILSFISCILDEREAKRGSEVENELGVYGVLVDMDGYPVQGAKVKAVPAEVGIGKLAAHASNMDSDSVVTDSKGRYAFDSLAQGRYNLIGDYESGTLVILIPDVVKYDTTKGLNLGTDTLRAPGRLRGKILLGDQGKEGVLAYVPGTSYLAISDDSGRFVIGGVPQGIHVVRYSTPGFLISPDSGVLVQSGKTTDLPVKRLAHDPALPPPAPRSLIATYDTLSESVRLEWDSVPVSDLDGYIIYRDAPSFLDPQVVPGGFTKTTFFIDTLPGAPNGLETKAMVYRVRSRDLELNLSQVYSSPSEVKIVSKKWVSTDMSFNILGKPDSITEGDTVRIILDFSNPTRKINSIRWSLPDGKISERIFEHPVLGGKDTLTWVASDPDLAEFHVQAIDDAGSPWLDTISILIVLDPPSAIAGLDLQVSIGDSVRLQGRDADGMGRIAKREWDIGGTGQFIPSGDGSVSFSAPSESGSVACIYRVFDDDGLVATDTLTVHVLNDSPVVTAEGPVEASIGDSLSLIGSGVDAFGSILDWQWSCGGEEYPPASPGLFRVKAPSTPEERFRCILQVLDDDGNEVRDSIFTRIVLDPPNVYAGPDTLISVGDSLSLIGTGSDRYGTIVSWEWGCAGGAFRESGSKYSWKAPDRSGKNLCVVKGTDDDGVSSYDSLIVDVVLDPPVAMAEFPRNVAFGGDSIKITAGRSTDKFGRIVKWEWDVGAVGVFRESSSPDTLLKLPTMAGSFSVVLRVTDDDGQIALDTASLTLLEIGGKAWLKTAEFSSPGDFRRAVAEFNGEIWVASDPLLSGAFIYHSADGYNWETTKAPVDLGSHFFVVFQNRLWAIGGTASPQIWNTTDGTNWVKIADTAAFGQTEGHACLVIGGKLWLIKPNGSRMEFWNSEDGLNWVLQSGATFVPAGYSIFTAELGGKFWLNSNGSLWSTSDGLNWNQSTTPPPYLDDPIPLHAQDGRLWVIGTSNRDRKSEVWSSFDGESWDLVTNKAAFGEQVHHFTLGFKGRIWLIGTHEVWSSN
jgi:hypothetical protein